MSSRPFGFEAGGVVVREEEAAVIRELAARLLAGESQDEMVRDVNRRGILTSYGKPWSRVSLRQILTRPRNCGLIIHRGAVVSRLPGEPILDEDTHDRIIALYTSRRRGHPISDAYLCSGIARCGHCGHGLTGRPRINMKPYDDGEVRRQYWCQPRARDGGCGRISVDQRELDRHVRALVVAILADPRHAAAVEAAARSVSEQRRKIEAKIADAEHTADVLAERLGRGEISLRRHDAATGPLEKRLAGLRAELAELDAEPAPQCSPEVVRASRATWYKRWDAATTPERRALLRQALRGRALVVAPVDIHAPRVFHPDRIVIEDR